MRARATLLGLAALLAGELVAAPPVAPIVTPKATTTKLGKVKITPAPADAANPIAVGPNHSAMSDTRYPLAHGPSHNTTDSVPVSTPSTKGLMSAADKTKLDGIDAGAQTIEVFDEGASQGTPTTSFNFIGANVSVTFSGGRASVTITPSTTTATLHTVITTTGTIYTAITTLEFQGAGVAVTNPVAGKARATIAGGGGGGAFDGSGPVDPTDESGELADGDEVRIAGWNDANSLDFTNLTAEQMALCLVQPGMDLAKLSRPWSTAYFDNIHTQWIFDTSDKEMLLIGSMTPDRATNEALSVLGTLGTTDAPYDLTASERVHISTSSTPLASTETATIGNDGADLLTHFGGTKRYLTSIRKTGIVTMVAGTVTVSDAGVTTTSPIVVTPRQGAAAVGTYGHVEIANIVPGVSFDISSTSATDVRSVSYTRLRAQ